MRLSAVSLASASGNERPDDPRSLGDRFGRVKVLMAAIPVYPVCTFRFLDWLPGFLPRSQGLKVADSTGGKTKAGDHVFMIKDRDGMLVDQDAAVRLFV